MNLLTRIKSAMFRKVIEHSLPTGSFDFLKRYGKEPDVSQAALVKKYWGWVYSCAQISAVRVASAPLRLYASRGKGETSVKNFQTKKVDRHKSKYLKTRFKTIQSIAGSEDFEEVEEHPLLELLQKINDQENSFEAKELTAIMLDLTGDAYWYLENNNLGVPDRMFVLRSQWVKVIPDEKNFVGGYLYGTEAQTNPVRLDVKDVIHFKYPNPFDPWYGLGPVQAAAYTVEGQQQREMFMIATMANMARPDLIVRYIEGELDQKDRQQLEREWNQLFRGAKQAGKVKVTDHRYEIEKIGWNPAELRFDQGEEWIMKKICSAFPVPVGLIDTTQISRAPRAGMEGSDLFMAEFNTLPRLTRIEEKLNEQLCPRYDDRLFLAFDNPVPRDAARQLQEDNMRLANFSITINEVREREGEEPVAWGDIPLAPPGIAPLGSPAGEGQEADSGNMSNSEMDDAFQATDLSGGAPLSKVMQKIAGQGMTIEVDGQHVHSSLAGIPLRLKPNRNEWGRFDKPGVDRLRAGGDAESREGLRRIWDVKK